LTPRGFTFNQQIAQWLATFTEINLLCGRFEGFDSRVSECVDVELSMGDFVSNGGEVPAMLVIEAVSRLLPGFVTKATSIQHESFSDGLNLYTEYSQFLKPSTPNFTTHNQLNLFDDLNWSKEKLPKLEHPQYSRPEVWHNLSVPKMLLQGDHKQIHSWRNTWYAD
jgi:tRNA (guanine37-N1)-methyltransferase